jgi:hypothetical protein
MFAAHLPGFQPESLHPYLFTFLLHPSQPLQDQLLPSPPQQYANKPFQTPSFAILAQPLPYKSFACHSYEKHGGGYQLFLFWHCSFATRLPDLSGPLSLVQSALPQNALITLLQSALPISLDLKACRIRTSRKTQGGHHHYPIFEFLISTFNSPLPCLLTPLPPSLSRYTLLPRSTFAPRGA